MLYCNLYCTCIELLGSVTSLSGLSFYAANDSASDSTGHVNLSRMGLNDNKAGMEGLDKDHINRVMMEASKGQTIVSRSH